MSRILEYLSQASPDEALIPGTDLAAARVQRVLQQLRQRMQRGDKAGERARRLLEYLESGSPEDAKFEGVSLDRLQSAVRRAQTKSLSRARNLLADQNATTSETLQSLIADVGQGNPGDTWVDGVNVTRLTRWLARLQHRAGDDETPQETPTRKVAAAGMQSTPAVSGEAPSVDPLRAVRPQNRASRKSEWIDDFLE